jgi:aspartyl aminopeptidase
MAEAVRRITTALTDGSGDDDLHGSALRRSFVLSVDMAHAVHPNSKAKHEATHAPNMNKGIVIKTNSNQRYASNGVTSFVVREIARRASLPHPQEFVVRNDCPCGSTIGPIISSNTGIRAVDIGMPQLSMHSIREMMGVADLTNFLTLAKAFYGDFRAVDEMIEGDGQW